MKYPFNNQIKFAAVAATTLCAVGAAAPVVQAQSTTRYNDDINLAPGTVIPVTLNTQISSADASEGDTFTATVDTRREAYDSMLRGATVDGAVKHVTQKEGKNPGTLELTFTRLHLADGTSYPISGKPTSLDSKDLKVNDDGVLQSKVDQKKQDTTYAGIGAGAGVLLGALNGGKIRLENILVGGGLGYAASQLLKGQQQVHDVVLKPGTPVGVLLDDRVRFHRRETINTVTPYKGDTHLKYYTHNGERWTYNPATGVRARVSDDPRPVANNGRRYYSYGGHPYYLDLNTGERVRLD